MDTHLGSKNLLNKVEIPDRRERLEFKDEWRWLLVSAFPNADKITVGPRLSGYSDARLWIATTTTGLQKQTFAVKLAQRRLIEKEFKNSGKVAGGALYGNPVKAEKPVLPDGSRLGLIIFTYQDDRQKTKLVRDSDHTNTLLEYLEKPDAPHIEEILEKVFARRGDTPEQPIQYVDYYDRLLFEHYKVIGLNGSDKNAMLIDAIELNKQGAMETSSPPSQKATASQFNNVQLQNFYLEKVEDNVLTLCYQSPGSQNEERDGTFRVKVKYHLAPNQSFPEEYDNLIAEPLFGQNPKSRFQLLRDCEKDILPTTGKLKRAFKYKNVVYPNPIDSLERLLFNNPIILKCS